MVNKSEVSESTSIDEDVDWISREIVWALFFLIDFKMSQIPFFFKKPWKGRFLKIRVQTLNIALLSKIGVPLKYK